MKHFGTFVGVDDSDVEWCNDLKKEASGEMDETDEEFADINIGDFIDGPHHATVEIDGKHVFKATCVKEAFSGPSISMDRLKRVQTMSSVDAQFGGVSLFV